MNEKEKITPSGDHDTHKTLNKADLSNIFGELKSELTTVFKTEMSSMRSEFHELFHTTQTKIESAISKSEEALGHLMDLETKNAALKNQVKTLEDEVNRMKHKESTLQCKIQNMADKVVSLDSYSRRENLIISGIQLTPDENCVTKVKKFFTDTLKIPLAKVEEIKFQRCHRHSMRGNKQESIICRFLWYEHRQLVWNSRSNLRNTTYTLSEDFPAEVNATRRILIPIMKSARDLGKRATVNGDKLIIDGRAYTKKNLSQLPKELDPARLATKHFEDFVAYYSRSSPLSNFYPCTELNIEGQLYDHVEQFFQKQKAIFADKQSIAREIGNTLDPLECKRLGDSINVDSNKWLPAAKDLMTKACNAKFTQDQRAKDFLLETGKKIIVEATSDKTWGIGLRLQDPNLSKKDNWSGQNNMGQILMTVRNNMQ